MLKRVTAALVRHATGRNVLMLLVVYLVINVGVLPLAQARLEAASNGVGPLDLMMGGYTAAEAYAAVAAYGDAGRELYMWVELTADVIYPLVYSLFFGLTIAYSFQRLLPAHHPFQHLAVVPIAAALLDFAENACIVTMLLNYPQQFMWVGTLAGVLTVIKWIVAILALAAMVIGLIGLVVRRMRQAAPPSTAA